MDSLDKPFLPGLPDAISEQSPRGLARQEDEETSLGRHDPQTRSA